VILCQEKSVFCKKPPLSPSIDADDFDVLAHPIRRQVDPAAVSTRFDFLFDHLYPEDSELGLGGLAGVIRLPADFFQTSFPFKATIFSSGWRNTLIPVKSYKVTTF
jgi:hypothetical protein